MYPFGLGANEMEKPNKGGGWPVIRYALKTARRAGGRP